MKNAHLRFGWLMYVKSTEKTTTSIKLHLDRFIGELLPDPPRQAKAHFISVVGGDTQISAIGAAISLGDRFMIEGPEVPPIRVCLEHLFLIIESDEHGREDEMSEFSPEQAELWRLLGIQEPVWA